MENPLIAATLKNDIVEVQKLLNQGVKIDQVDHFGTTALHLAAMYGYAEITELLLEKGAKLNLQAYKERAKFAYTPLDLAVKFAPNTLTVEVLAKKNASSNHINTLILDMFNEAEIAYAQDDFQKFDLNLKKLEIMVQHLNAAKKVNDGYEPVPTSLLTEVYAQDGITDPRYYDRMMMAAQSMADFDFHGLAQAYIFAKNLTHAFPSDNQYTFEVGDISYNIQAEGHFANISVPCAFEAIKAFDIILETATDANYGSLAKQFSKEFILKNTQTYYSAKKAFFDNLAYTFEVASQSVKMAWQHEISEQLYKDYMNGQTILLPSGWSGHAVEVIIDKNYDLLMVANGGDRHASIPAGVNAYHLESPLSIDDIYQILTNEEKINLEYKYYYDWNMVADPEFSFSYPAQSFGNCAWYSQIIAQQALLFLDLKKAGVQQSCATKLSEVWFQELNDFQQTKILKDYLAHPALEVAALGDILIDYHNDLSTAAQKERVNLILNSLSVPEYKMQFNAYCAEHQKSFSKALKEMITLHGFKVKEVSDVLDIEDILEHRQEFLFEQEVEITVTTTPIAEPEPVIIFSNTFLYEPLELVFAH